MPEHLQAWRDARLREVSAGAVLRDMSLFGSVLTQAVHEWHRITRSPMTDVRRPTQPKHRQRIITWSETRAMLPDLGNQPGKPPRTLMAQMGYALVLALRTGMRASEIEGLTWDRVHARRLRYT